jgi:hypothetical protein
MATGRSLLGQQMPNAHAIAQMKYMPTAVPQGDLLLAEKLIDKLATLQSIYYTSLRDKQLVSEVITREYSLNKENGISTTLDFHRNFVKTSLVKDFEGNKYLMHKGYSPEIYNPSIDVKVELLSEEKTMKKHGYTLVETLTQEGNGPKMGFYVNKNNALATRVKSIVSLKDKKRKGTDIFQSIINEIPKSLQEMDENIDGKAVHREAKKRFNAIHKSKNAKTRRDFNIAHPKKTNTNFMIPVLNDKGEIVNYRYMMSERMRNAVLEKDNRFDVIIGKMEGTSIDKQNSAIVNRKTVELLHEDFKENYFNHPDRYVEINKKATNPRLKEIYALIPKEMMNDISNIWGKDKKIYVREDLLDLVFGYSKASAADAITSSKYGRFMIPHKHILKLVGDIWQDLVSLAKDNIVIKSFVVLKDNVISNTILLMLKGVPITDIIKGHATALQALRDYQNDLNRVDEVRRLLRASTTLSKIKRKRLEGERGQLQTALSNNPIKDLVDEGIFQSIIEDIDMDNGKYGIRNRISRKVDKVAKKYKAQPITKVAKYSYLSRDTGVYSFLLKSTQYSDFVARYTLYQHLELNAKSKAHTAERERERQANIRTIVDTFINYDVPTGRELQWLNDMGIMMFTKFFFRIQKVILSTFKDNPANYLSYRAFESMTGEHSDIMDSLMGVSANPFNKLNSPLGIFDSASEMHGINHVMNIFD